MTRNAIQPIGDQTNMKTGTNAPSKPEFEGQIVKFKSPHFDVMLYDIAVMDEKYNRLTWYALNEPTPEQVQQAFFTNY
jgi:hypothetical protein